jgi:hypothetical protein
MKLTALRMLLGNQASSDPIRAAEALIKLEAREARLLGLDMPTKVAVTPTGAASAGGRASGAGPAGPGEGERGGGGCDAGTATIAARP